MAEGTNAIMKTEDIREFIKSQNTITKEQQKVTSICLNGVRWLENIDMTAS